MPKEKLNLDKTWTLFLDRDGVLNRELPGKYIKLSEELEILPGVREAMAIFAESFGHIFVATNQQGIGKGLMNERDLHIVHFYLWKEIDKAGGRIDDFYFCPGLEEDNPPCRKPNPGMAYEAKRDFPEVRFEKSIMIGDKLTDMEFGKSVGMVTVFIGDEAPSLELADYCVPALIDFARIL